MNEVVPASEAIEAKDFSVTRRLMKEASELGLLSVDIPEEYGGLEMDKVTLGHCGGEHRPSRAASRSRSRRTWASARCRMVWYGTPEQKQKYLPKLA